MRIQRKCHVAVVERRQPAGELEIAHDAEGRPGESQRASMTSGDFARHGERKGTANPATMNAIGITR